MDMSSYRLERLREDTELTLYRGVHMDTGLPVLLAVATTKFPEAHFDNEISLATHLDPAWAVLPIRRVRHEGRAGLVLDDCGGQPLDRILGAPMPLGQFLTIGIGLSTALRDMHASGLVHKEIKPANVIIDESGNVRLTGFGIATRLPRQRQAPTAAEVISGSFAYMAPEQTGRMNRLIDSRSDLYALGMTLYEMLVGAPPFAATDPLDWIYCHIARPPPPPSIRIDGVPPSIERIVLKLLEKNADDRYQTAAGVAHDLRRFRAAWRANRLVRPFPLAERDRSDRLIIPEKLYGREADVGALTAAFERVAKSGKFEFVMVSGDTGAGKSSVVNEIQPALHSARGLFAASKCDQHKSDIPYASLAEAFQGLLRRVLSQNTVELGKWREALLESVGASGELIADLIPELRLILGNIAPPPILSPADEKSRFQHIFCQFIGVFARPEHPLVLFVDDLQWLDPATIELLERIAVSEQIPHLLLIGAFRSEADLSEPLAHSLARIRAKRGEGTEIRLSPLAPKDVRQLLADTLQQDPQHVAELAEVVFQKTHGNPFFVAQFVQSLASEALLAFDSEAGEWRWDLERVRLKKTTDNVGDLMAEKLLRYDDEALRILKRFACLGNAAPTSTLSRALQAQSNEVEKLLREFIDIDLIARTENGYEFAHDSIRQAAYDLIPRDQRPAEHLAIARLLSKHLGADELEERAFEIVNQFNRAEDLVKSPDERQWLAELNLMAGKRAKNATAYDAALAYIDAGCGLLQADCWHTQYRTTFELQLHRAHCKFILGDTESAEAHYGVVSAHAVGPSDRAQVVGHQMILFAYQGRIDRAIVAATHCLEQMGVSLPTNPTHADVQQEYDELVRRMAGREIESLFDLPHLVDSHWRDVIYLLEELLGPVSTLDADFLNLVLLRMANISLAHGNSHEACHAYANLGGRVLGWRVGSFDDGRRFSELAMRMIEDLGYDRYAARVYAIISGTVAPWSLPLHQSYDIARKAIEMPRERGGFTYSAWAWCCALTALLDSGKNLAEVARLAEVGLAFVRKAKFTLAIEMLATHQLVAKALRGEDPDMDPFAGYFENAEYEAYLSREQSFKHAHLRYNIRKLQVMYFAGDYPACIEIAGKLGGNLGESPILEQSPVFEVVEYCFYSALARAAHLTGKPAKAWERHGEALKISLEQLLAWTERCPDNFSDRAHLVAAEVARLESRVLDAEGLYEEAIRLSRKHGFVQNEALANELAARFYSARGFDTIADAYRRHARECYERWGAGAKVRQLDQQYPQLGRDGPRGTATTGVGQPLMEQFDLTALIEMYQAVSKEIMLDRVIERLMTMAVEHAGAVRGLLLLERDGAMRLVAEAVSHGDTVHVAMRSDSDLEREAPQSILNYVSRTREFLILDDAMEPNAYSSDQYLAQGKPRSILCLPLIKQQRMVGILYLDNNLTAHIFTPARLSILQLLASQAAISIENAELFRDIHTAQDQARRVGEELRNTFDLMPALAWRASAIGAFEFANKQWHDYTGIAPDDPELEKRWLDPFHPDDIPKFNDRWRHLSEFRTSGEVEMRMRRFDGEYRNFLVRATPLRDERGEIVQWHGTNTDIENIKRAEQAQEALARVSRVTSMGQLTVSIAHEVNQPLMAIVTNAASCIRWLNGETVNIAEARSAAERIVRDGHRAGDVIASIRALAKKSPTEFVELDLNEVVAETLVLARNELERQTITVRTSLAAEIGLVLADRVQMQQVILNLIMNGIEAMSAAEDNARVLQFRTERADDGFVHTSVSDSGPGLDPENTDRIFDAFFTTKLGGVGMGLSICRSIIESHGGRIFVTPNRPCGSTFTFSVPTVEEARPLISLH